MYPGGPRPLISVEFYKKKEEEKKDRPFWILRNKYIYIIYLHLDIKILF